MLPADIKSQINSIWNDFWSGGISNPLEVMEQLTYLLFIKRLDELHTLAERKAVRLGTSIERPIFPAGEAPTGGRYDDLRWSQVRAPQRGEMFDVVDNHVFPFIRAMAIDHRTPSTCRMPASQSRRRRSYARPSTRLDKVPMADRDTKGDVYEYMLSKIATAGQNGQFRTPRHIIQLMVEMMAPTPDDTICDPACGTAGFLVAAGEYIRREHPEALTDAIASGTSTTECSTASTSTTRCCASAR